MTKQSLIIFVILAALFAAVNISAKNQEKKNAPIEQNIETAAVTITAPPLTRRELTEQNVKEQLKDKIKTIYFYSSIYKKVEYIVHYCEYKNKARLQSGISTAVAKFKDNKFNYKTVENKIGMADSILLEGTFEKGGKKFGIKQQFITYKTHFWQILSIYPYSVKNEKAAEEFIKSISLGSIEKK
ncbi:MAG: hypothetical protein LBD46_05535 [Endomicrobium sp.]|jgi:hypothetical protein|nr:hypothetical protein [Endomicrobium sp.]